MDQSAAAVAFAAAKNLLISLSPLPTRVLEKRRETETERRARLLLHELLIELCKQFSSSSFSWPLRVCYIFFTAPMRRLINFQRGSFFFQKGRRKKCPC